MKTFVRIVLAMIAVLSISVSAMAQDGPTTVPKYEISIGGGAGITGMGIMDKSAWRNGLPWFSEYFNAPKWVPGPGGHFGLFADINFTDNYGLIVGLEAANYFTLFRGNDVLSVTNYPYDQEVVINAPARPFFHKKIGGPTRNKYETWVYSQIEELGEDHAMVSLQIPVMFKYMTPIKPLSPHKYYIAAGAKFGIHVTPDYWVQYGSPGVYVAHNTQYDHVDPVKNGFGKPSKEYGVRRNHEQSDAESWNTGWTPNRNICPVDVLLSLDTGFRWRLTDKIGLYTGLYCDFGMIRPVKYDKETAVKLLNFQEGGIEEADGHALPYAMWSYVQNEPLVTAAAPDYIGVETADDATQTVSQWYEYSDKPYVKFLNNMQAGVKLRLSFAVGKAEKKVKQPKEPRQPKPKPEKVPPKIQKTMMELSDALFAFDKFDLNEDARRMLDEVAAWLNDNPELHVEIGGHTDDRGSDAYNQKLSENRAKAVYDYFISHGVSKARLSYKGYGESRPIATNETDEGRQRNRRVELQIQE